MMRRRRLLVFLISLILPLSAAAASKPAQALPPQEIVLRHALTGPALSALAELVLRFNDEEMARGKERARIKLEDAAALADKGTLPHLAFFAQDDALTLFATRPRFLPLAKVYASSGRAFDQKGFFPQLIDAVDDLSGRMQALPMGMSLPVLFYNREAFLKAGLDPEKPPKTWWELQEAAGALRDAGFACPLTSSRFAWVHVENVSAQHGEPLLVREGRQARLAIDGLVNVKHLALLTSWHKSRYFVYSGAGVEGDARFARGECAMLTGESALYARLLREAPPFSVAIAELPHYDDVFGARPTHVLPDGAALWVLAADKRSERVAIARFIDFLLRPANQAEWVRKTGFLPMTPQALPALREAGIDSHLLERAAKRLSMAQTGNGRSKYGFGKNRIRALLAEEIEFVWGGEKPPKAALDAVVARARPFLGAPAAR
ncbi:MAG: extracellular solute-binding protein [Rhodocyclaceae bacterium]|nr:extracellular solute-binding protein [Rhodocyclaceae bacterium]